MFMNQSRSIVIVLAVLVVLALLFVGLFGFGSGGQSVPVNAPTNESAQVELAEGIDETPALSLEASFMSENQTFAYTFNYDGNLLQLLDTPLTGASGYGPSFQVKGGAEITGSTVLFENFDDSATTSTQIIGSNEVQFSSSVSGECTVEQGVVDFAKEALVLRLRVCPGNDAETAKQSFKSLFSGLEMKAL